MCRRALCWLTSDNESIAELGLEPSNACCLASGPYSHPFQSKQQWTLVQPLDGVVPGRTWALVECASGMGENATESPLGASTEATLLQNSVVLWAAAGLILHCLGPSGYKTLPLVCMENSELVEC